MGQLAVATPPDERIELSYADYLALTGEQNQLLEWVNGKVITHIPPKPRHQEMVGFLFALLYLFVRFHRLGRLYTAPMEMRIEQLQVSREPDILFVASASLTRITDKRLDGPADLIVEIVSDDSVARDRADKFYEYQEAGVQEYWIVDPRPGYERADFWVLDSRGKYRPVALTDGIYRSAVLPGFWLQVDWLWRSDLPDPLLLFAEIAALPASVIDSLNALTQEL